MESRGGGTARGWCDGGRDREGVSGGAVVAGEEGEQRDQ
jgi:hypothetical protein